MNCTTLSPRKLFIPTTAVLLLLVSLNGCKKYHHGSTQLASNVQQVVNRPKLDMMKWADYSDYQAQVKQFYDARESATAWTEEDGDPTSQAKAMIQAFTTADEKGLKPVDYDASRWPQRLARIGAIRRNNDTSANAQDNVAQFDAALTISAMRYLSDLHSGRINPQQLNFDIDTPSKRKAFDLAAYLNDKVVEADDVPAAITEVEPDQSDLCGDRKGAAAIHPAGATAGLRSGQRGHGESCVCAAADSCQAAEGGLAHAAGRAVCAGRASCA